MKQSRQKHSATFKAKVALNLISRLQALGCFILAFHSNIALPLLTYWTFWL